MRPDPFGPILDDVGVVILDGGLATQLEAQGNDLSDRLWSARLLVEDPEQIVAAHLAYYRAGARVATTASYQATFEGFAARGIGHADAADLMRRSVELAMEARSRYRAERASAGLPDAGTLLVAASVGPYGAMLADGSEYRGRYGLSIEALRDFHRARLRVLAGSGADVIACETIPELEEAQALVSLLEETPDAFAWLSFSCADGGHIRSDVPVEEAVAAASVSERVVAVGFNCTAPEHIDELIGRARATTDRPIVVYPNSGEGWDASARAWTDAAGSAGALRPGARVDGGPVHGARVDGGPVHGAAARRWVAEGATLVGGCCRVTPDQIAVVAQELVGSR